MVTFLFKLPNNLVKKKNSFKAAFARHLLEPFRKEPSELTLGSQRNGLSKWAHLAQLAVLFETVPVSRSCINARPRHTCLVTVPNRTDPV